MKPQTFAFLIHPLDPRRDVCRKYPALGVLPGWLIEFISIFYPAVFISEIKGARSQATGQELQGWFVACPLSARLMMRLPPSIVYRKIIESGRLAERLGARILGLGAFSSVVGDGGLTVSSALNIPVTTGNSYTVGTSVAAVRFAAKRMGVNLQQATAAVVGASGSIGSVCARLLASEVSDLILVGRREVDLQAVATVASEAGAARIVIASDLECIHQADVVLTVTSSVEALIQPDHLRTGAIVCDVARPRDVAHRVAVERPDVLVFEGGVVRVPGNVDFGFDFGFPPGMAYACMAETMALAMEGRFESYSLGKRLLPERIAEIEAIASRHGFALGGLRNFDRTLSAEEVDMVIRQRLSQRVGTNASTPVAV